MDINLINKWKQALIDLPVNREEDKFLTDFVSHLEVESTSHNGQAFLSKGKISLGELIYEVKEVPEEVLRAEIFFHEVGHHIAFLMDKTKEERAEIFEDYSEYRKNSSLKYDDYDEKSIFQNPEYAFLEGQFKDCVTSKEKNSVLGFMKNGVVVDTTKEYIALSNIGEELKWIYHEQFAESFAFTMIKQLYPESYETLLKERIISRESEQQFFGESSVNEAPEATIGGKPFVHKIAKALNAYTMKLNETPEIASNFSTILETIRPIAEKYTILEAKDLMMTHRLDKYFPEELNKGLTDIDDFNALTKAAVKANIKELRAISRLLDDDLFNAYLEGNDKKKPNI